MKTIKEQFPIFKNHDVAYLDNAATTQKPESVIKAIDSFYKESNSNIHRGVYKLSERATELYEHARADIAKFINAASEKEIIFTKGTTESINLVALSLIKPGDEVIISEMEHHANIVPWQLAGAKLQVARITDDGEIDIEHFKTLFTPKTKLVALVHVSNTLGTINPLKELIKIAHDKNTPVLIDGAQSIAHKKVDIKDLDADFYAFSGHKMYGPTGIGVLYGKKSLLDSMQPYQGGGDMIRSVSFEETTFADTPQKFEAGTPNIAGTVGLSAAVHFIQKIGYDMIKKHEESLLKYATEQLEQINDLKIIGKAKNKAGIISFVLDGIHPHDIGTILDQNNIAVRTGHHCTQPLMKRFGVPATTRASFALYNTKEDVDKLVDGILKVQETFSK